MNARLELPQQRPVSRRAFLAGLAAACLCGPVVAAAAREHARTAKGQRRVLLVATNVGSVSGHVSGTFLKEIAFPFKVFIDQDYAVDVVTPSGGKAAIYAAGTTSDELTQIQNDSRYIQATSQTLAAVDIDAARYDGIYYPGGHGQFWDVVDNAPIAAAAAAIHERGGVIGSAGHGTASLVNVKRRNGDYFVAGKRMTCFPTWAEKEWMDISEYGRLLPFDMEDVLRERGADLVVCTRDTMKQSELTLLVDTPHRLITGSFASSAGDVARAMHTAMVQREVPEQAGRAG